MGQTFEGFLQKDFENIPGERQVLEGRYHITDRQCLIIQRSAWHNFAKAKAQLSMAIILARTAAVGRCPKCQTPTAKAYSHGKTVWYVCLFGRN